MAGLRKNASQKRGEARTPVASAAEMLERKVVASRLFSLGYSRGDVKRDLEYRFGLTANQSENTVAGVEADIQAEYDATRPMARAMAIHRLRSVIVKCSGSSTTTETVRRASGKASAVVETRTREAPPDYGAVLRAEQLLARIEGTMVPQRVDVVHRAMPALVADYMATLTEEDCDDLMEEAKLLQLPADASPSTH